jgi:siroheme synthase
MCAVFNATRQNERIVSGTLATIHALVQSANASGPCLLLMARALRPEAVKRKQRDVLDGIPLPLTGRG